MFEAIRNRVCLRHGTEPAGQSASGEVATTAFIDFVGLLGKPTANGAAAFDRSLLEWFSTFEPTIHCAETG